MDFLTLVRTMGALGLVLGLLTAALWLVKRYNIRLPGALAGGPAKRVALVEKTGIDSRRSVALIRRDGREHLILLAPEGHLIIESGIIRDEIDEAAAAAQAAEAEARAAAAHAAAMQAQQNMRAMLSTVAERSAKVRRKVATAAGATARSLQPEPSFEAMVTSASEAPARSRRKSKAASAAQVEPVIAAAPPQAPPSLASLASAFHAALEKVRPVLVRAGAAAKARSSELCDRLAGAARAVVRAGAVHAARLAAQGAQAAGEAQERLSAILGPPIERLLNRERALAGAGEAAAISTQSSPPARRRAPARLKVTDSAGNIVVCEAARG